MDLQNWRVSQAICNIRLRVVSDIQLSSRVVNSTYKRVLGQLNALSLYNV